MIKKRNYFIFAISLIIISLGIISAQTFSGGVPSTFSGSQYQVFGSSTNPQFTAPGFYTGTNDYLTGYNKEDCNNRQDFILMIPPGGCKPSVVRSDLLEERNVPVFCKVSSIKLNPLIDVSKIRSIRFAGRYPKEVASISYYPARAAIRSGAKLVGSPVAENVGYLVVVLKKQFNETEMSDWIEGEVTATIDYDVEGIYGVGRQDFFLTELSDADWQRNYQENSFWKGKGYIRVDSITGGTSEGIISGSSPKQASISIYRDSSQKVSTVHLKEGETSKDIHLGGYYCAAGMNIKLNKVDYPVDKALLRVNGQDLWVTRGSQIINGKCSIGSINTFEVGGGRISLNCRDTGRFDLVLNTAKARLGVEKKGQEYIEKEYQIEEFVTGDNLKNVKVAFVGRYSKADSNYVILIESFNENNPYLGISSFIHKKQKHYNKYGHAIQTLRDTVLIVPRIVGGEEEERFYKYLLGEIEKEYPAIGKENIKVLIDSDSVWDKGNYKIILKNSISGEYLLEKNPDLKKYYDESINNYNDVYELYPYENKGINEGDENKKEIPYAVEGLSKAAEFSGMIGLRTEQIQLLEKIIEKYPDLDISLNAKQTLENIKRYNIARESQALAYIDNEPHFITLLDIRKPGYEDLGVEVLFSNRGDRQVVKLERNEVESIYVNDKEVIGFKILEIYDNSIKVEYTAPKTLRQQLISTAGKILFDRTWSWTTKTIGLGESIALSPEVSVKINKINLKKEARVSIIPKVYGTRSQANLTFKIAVEKRLIKLSPEKANDLMKKIDKQIKEWSEINNKLNKVIKGLKGACFATSAVLTVKNFFTGLSGEAKARNDIMTSSGGWNEKCRKDVNDKKYTSVQSCLLDNNDKINNDVEVYKKEIEKRNEEIKRIQESPEIKDKATTDWFFTESYDIKSITNKYNSDEFSDFYEENQGELIKVKGETNPRTLKNLVEGKESKLTVEEMKETISWNNIKNDPGASDVLKDMADKKLGNTFYDFNMRTGYSEKRDELRNHYSEYGISAIEDIRDRTKSNAMNTLKPGDKAYDKLGGSNKAFLAKIPLTYVEGRTDFAPSSDIAGKKVMIGLALSGSSYVINKAVVKEGDKMIDVTKSVKSYYNKKGIQAFNDMSSKLFDNQIKGEVKVLYYERAPYKGLPALVPFDHENGWYVATDYVISGFGKPFEESGRAINFYVCNVGDNGLIEFKKNIDDICRYYNLGTSAGFDFPGLSKTDSLKKVNQAQRALKEASNQYGRKTVVINGKSYKTGIAENGESGSCSDFMSPEECYIMFNVCDPVICPSSRCDFGGDYRVDNVVQSGIIGSLVLCFPNIKEGIFIPICLTGVHAGIDNFLSIMNASRQCLNESIETGRNIGICDEITSIYLCDFFWKQAAPLMDMILPKFIETVSGQGARGGGEYLTIQDSWDNLQKSLTFFKNEYAVNAFKAFNLRSTEEIGNDFCKMHVSGKYPTSADFFNNLVEPESPVQFTAWFSENKLNDATIPPTSSYKIYYHIYAGKDSGAYYNVYLKGPGGTGLVHYSGMYNVGSGYIERGGYVDNTPDIIAPTGFTELCISVNGQEKCGFGKVTTNSAINYLGDKYAAEQASETEITSSKDCVSGESSVYSLFQPNLQSAVEEVLNPELYKKGITRVCSSERPNAQTEPISGDLDRSKSIYDRWRKVGYCDDPSIGCWVDLESVKDILGQNKLLLNQTLNSINTNYTGEIEILDIEKSNKIKKQARELIKKIRLIKPNEFSINDYSIKNDTERILNKLKVLSEKGPSNSYRASGLFYRAWIYEEIAKKYYHKGWKLISSSEKKSLSFLEKTKNFLGGEPTQTSVSVSVDKTRLNRILNGQEKAPQTGWAGDKALCAAYARWAAKDLFGLVYDKADAWCRGSFNGDVRAYRFEQRVKSNNNELKNLEIKGILQQGMIIGTYNPGSDWNNDYYTCSIRERVNGKIVTTGSKKIRAGDYWTHNLLYLGKNTNNQLVFAERWGTDRIRTLEEFERDGLIVMVIVGAPPELNTQQITSTDTAEDTTKDTAEDTTKDTAEDTTETTTSKCEEEFCLKWQNDKGWIVNKQGKGYNYYIKEVSENVYGIYSGRGVVSSDILVGNIRDGEIKFTRHVTIGDLLNYKLENKEFKKKT